MIVWVADMQNEYHVLILMRNAALQYGDKVCNCGVRRNMLYNTYI